MYIVYDKQYFLVFKFFHFNHPGTTEPFCLAPEQPTYLVPKVQLLRQIMT